MMSTNPEKLVSQSIMIEGMSCASCVGRVERVLAAVDGVRQVSVNLATEMARIESALPIDFDVLQQAIDKAGYQARPAPEPFAPAAPAVVAPGASGYAVLLAALLSLPLVLPMLLELAGVHWMPDGRIQFMLATPV